MIYSEMRPDADLLNELRDERSVFLLGCPACANMSLHIDKAPEGSPVMTITPSGYKTVSMAQELERLEKIFTGKGLEVASWVGKYPLVAICIADNGVRKTISKKSEDFDLVVTLSSDAGRKNVENILPSKKIAPAMNAKGIVNATTRKNKTMSNFSLIKVRSVFRDSHFIRDLIDCLLSKNQKRGLSDAFLQGQAQDHPTNISF